MRTPFLFFVCAMASAGCADRGAVLQQPVGTTTATATVTAAPADSAAVAPAPSSDATPSAPPNANADLCADPPVVAFSGSSTVVTETQIEVLRHLAECLNAAPNEETTVVLIGYTDLMGTVPANIELGLTRAQGVMKELVSSRVAPGRIVVASAGELQRPSARLGLHAPRVEILVARGGAPRPNEAPITRGIDAEGLIRPPPKKPVTSSPAPMPNRPANVRPPPKR
jgi:outer membrane protein OmpA-like peptidoglycan-associated protein